MGVLLLQTLPALDAASRYIFSVAFDGMVSLSKISLKSNSKHIEYFIFKIMQLLQLLRFLIIWQRCNGKQ
jgi:hypothetical protein